METKRTETHKLWYLLRDTAALTEAYVDGVMAEAELTPQQGVVLKTIYFNGATSNAELCTGMHLTKGTISGIVKRLEKKGLITRETNSADRRQEKLLLSEEGKFFLGSIYKKGTDVFEKAVGNMGKDNISHCLQMVVDINEKVGIEMKKIK